MTLSAGPLMTPLAYPAGEVGVIDIGHRHFVRVMASELNRGPTAWMWWHDCPAVDHVSWGWFGDALDGRASGHVIESVVPLTVRGSLVCEACRDHGFIEDFRWRPV